MLQGTLITDTQMNQKIINRSGIVAKFTNNEDETYDVEISINNTRFLCNYAIGESGFDFFEIIASKGINTMTKKLVILLKETVLCLSYRI